ncbi:MULTISPECIES: hypothetical protein [Comamonas]|uniref:hypothetical protein n=1 Tax=Comamonas TaxID=283 RepID=UPI00142F7206|nr:MULTISPECIES: hypothetical protein [Comamonas]MDH1477001.1 hypothetical protein [Comamonas thiooxydans]
MNRNDANHKSNQHNPQHPAWQQANDNKSNQSNPNNRAYWQSRGLQQPSKKK